MSEHLQNYFCHSADWKAKVLEKARQRYDEKYVKDSSTDADGSLEENIHATVG